MCKPSLFFLLHFPEGAAECFLDGEPILDVVWRYERQRPGQWQVVTEDRPIIFENQEVDFDNGAVVKDVDGQEYRFTAEARCEISGDNWQDLLGPDCTDEILRLRSGE